MTYIYETCTVNDAIDRARKLDRLNTPDSDDGNFTSAAIEALFDYHEQLAEDMGEPLELDIIAWCCDWSEHASFWQAYEDEYADPSDIADGLENDEDEREAEARQFFEDNTQIIEFDGGVLVQSF